MTTTCQDPNHFNQQIILLCTNSQCKSNPYLCSQCLPYHQDCLDKLLLMIETRSSFGSSGPKGTEKTRHIRNALDILDDIESKKELLECYQDLLEDEFEKLTRYFGQRIHETKLLIVEKARGLYETKDFTVSHLKQQLKKLYKFGASPSIIDALDYDRKDTEMIKKGLETFFSGFEIDETKKKTYRKAKSDEGMLSLNNLERNKLETLKKFQREMSDFSERLASKEAWKWDSINKSDLIALSNGQMIAEKRVGTKNIDSAILGSIVMTEGFYKWEIEVGSQWICFGIIDPYLVKDMEAFSYKESVGMDTARGLYSMERVYSLNDYKNKKYVCELDMENGSFRIYNCGKLVSKYEGDFKGQSMVPFVDFYNAGGKVKLRIL